MAYDVFISYSREDKEKAEALCTALEEAGISYWIDRNIHGSANFLSQITAYIKSCKVVVFVASANSAKSKWTQKEILFAIKCEKEIVPYRIGDFQFKDNDELDFVFTNVQWVESLSAVVESLKELGCATASQEPPQPAPQPALAPKPTPTPKSKPIPQPMPAPTKTYKVGDYYDEGKKQGVVFEVTADGQHGKIVSLTETKIEWAKNEDFGVLFTRKNPAKVLIGANDECKGVYNMMKVMKNSNWRNKYPAFAWCANLGEGWYLPAIEELKKFTLDDTIHDAVNSTLATKGKKLANKGEIFRSYWSSTESDRKCITGEFRGCGVDMLFGGPSLARKSNDRCVRAVATF